MTTNEWSAEPTAADALVTMHNPLKTTTTVKVFVPCHKVVRSTHPVTGVVTETVIGQEERVISWAPGETRQVPAWVAHCAHQVVGCSGQGEHKDCLVRGSPGICRHPGTAGPGAYISGGLAPMLVRIGAEYRLHPSLVPVVDKTPRPSPVAQGDVAAAMGQQVEDDPLLARARARRAAKGGGQ